MIYLGGRVDCGVWGDYFLLSLDSTQSSEMHYKMQHNYFSTGFCKWTNTLSQGSVSIFVTTIFVHKKEFLFLKSLKGFGDLLQRSHNFLNFYNSNHLKDLVIHILWTWQCPSPTLRRWSSQWFSDSWGALHQESAAKCHPSATWNTCSNLIDNNLTTQRIPWKKGTGQGQRRARWQWQILHQTGID